MKIRKVIDICVKSGSVQLWNGEGCQWIGDGGAAYAFYNLPHLTCENVPTMFDIPDEKSSMVRMIGAAPPILSELYPDESAIERNALASRFCPDGLVPFSGMNGLIFIKQKYLSPFKDDGNIFFFERRGYIAVKLGLTLCAVIAPYTVINDEYLDGLSGYLEECRLTAENNIGSENTD